MNYTVLCAELKTDPLKRGYASKTDAQVANSLNTANRTRQKTTLTSAQIFENIVVAEFQTLTDAKKLYVRDVLGLGGDIAVGPNSKARAVLIGAFGVDSATIAALAAAITESISRAAELGLSGVSSGHIASARSLINGQ